MAIALLVMKVDSNHTRTGGRYFAGDIADILAEKPGGGFVLGQKVDPDTNPDTKFYVIIVDGIDKSNPRVQLLLEEGDLVERTVDGETVQRLSKRRKLFLDINSLPNRIKNALQRDGKITLDVGDLSSIDTATQPRVVT